MYFLHKMFKKIRIELHNWSVSHLAITLEWPPKCIHMNATHTRRALLSMTSSEKNETVSCVASLQICDLYAVYCKCLLNDADIEEHLWL